jgi:heme/copper-type cytochrome/quinol oxidase subunit 2
MHAILAQAQTKYFWLPRQASTVAGSSDDLFNIILYLCIFFFLLVTFLLLLFVIVYRHKRGVKRDVSATHSMTLEITWTVIPSIIVVFLYYYGFKEYMNLAVEPPNSYTVTVTGRMWQWSFDYPEGYQDGELHVPVNAPIRCILQSDDVIHSLSIPAFRVKKDVVPGRYNRLWFQATDADGALYLTAFERDQKPVEVGVDVEGEPIVSYPTRTPNQLTGIFKNQGPLVQGGLTAQAGGAAIAPDAVIRIYTLLNGSNLYATYIQKDGKSTELLVNAAGASPPHETVQFDTLPGNVQKGLREQSGGADVPGSQPVMRFDDAKAFEIYCTDYCGTNHSTMHSRVIVHRSQADFDVWLKRAIDISNTGTPSEKGQKLYAKLGCAQCHSVDGTRITGPSWKDLYGSTQKFTDGSTAVVNEEFLHGFLPAPTARLPVGDPPYPPAMPPFPIATEQMDNIAAYMKSISKFAPPPTSTGGVGVGTTRPATQPASAPAVSEPPTH